MIKNADGLWPRQACRRKEATWRAEAWKQLGPNCHTIDWGWVVRYFAVAPWWYRMLTSIWSKWAWVKI